MKLLDTCFLIDLQRERVRGQAGPAGRFLAAWPDEQFAVSAVTAVEFLEGYERGEAGERLLALFLLLPVTLEVARVGGRLRRALRQQGRLIGDFDLLIAATAMAADVALVTDNTRHFERVDGLKLETYTGAGHGP